MKTSLMITSSTNGLIGKELQINPLKRWSKWLENSEFILNIICYFVLVLWQIFCQFLRKPVIFSFYLNQYFLPEQSHTWKVGNKHKSLVTKPSALYTPTLSSYLPLLSSIQTNSRKELHFLLNSSGKAYKSYINAFGKGQDFSFLCGFLKMISCSCLAVCAVTCLSSLREPAAGSSSSVGMGMMAYSCYDIETISVCAHLQVCEH